jgi:hypothetical protein
MKFLRRFLMRLSNFVTGRSADQRLQDEIAEHLAFQTEENCAPACRRRGAAAGRTQAWRGRRRSGKTITPSKAFPSSRICSSTCGTRFACF